MSQSPNGQGLPDDMATIRRLMEQYPFLFNAADKRDNLTVAEVVKVYLADAAGELAKGSFALRQIILDAFVARFGARRLMDCTPFELKQWITERYPGSPWTRGSVNMAVQRAFSWATRMKIIRDNPFHGLNLNEEKKPGRDMKRDELQAILRKSDPYFRRFLIALLLTGARPCELSALQWSHIDWQRGIATLHQHKTAKKTGKPRILVFSWSMIKLLRWIQRNEHGACAHEMQTLLENAPYRQLPVREVVKKLMASGYSYRCMYRARDAIGATYKRIGGWGEHGYVVYSLPMNATRQPPPHNHVFRCCRVNRPWRRGALTLKFLRIRRAIGLPPSCKLYGLRHAYISEAVKRGTNLKALATLVGHQTIGMLERAYCHVTDSYDFLHAAGLQALGLPAQEKPAPVVNEGTEPAGPVTDECFTMVLKRLMDLEEQLKNPRPEPKPLPDAADSPAPPKLQDCQRICYDLFKLAIAKEPSLANATDEAAFEWLRIRPEFQRQLPPAFPTFRRYLHQARKVLEGAGKQKLRRQGFIELSSPTPHPDHHP